MAAQQLEIDDTTLFDNLDDRQVEFDGRVDGEDYQFAVQYSVIEALSGNQPDGDAEVSFRRYTRRRDVLRLLFASVIEAFCYRPLTLVFRLRAFWRMLRGDRRWGVMQREGFGAGRADGTQPRKAA